MINCIENSLQAIQVCYWCSLIAVTPWLPTCFQLKASSLHASLCRNISAAVSVRELFKPSKDLASLRVCNEKQVFQFWVLDFLWVTS